MLRASQNRIDALRAAGLWGDETLHGLLLRNASQYPSELAVKDQPNIETLTGLPARELSWSELCNASGHFADGLRSKGVTEGDKLLVQLPNMTELLVLYYAAAQIGAVVSPVPVQYGRHELRTIADAIDCEFAVSLANFRDTEPAKDMQSALPEVRVLVIDQDLLLKEEACQSHQSAVDDADRVLTICWTSGTTGTPKGVPRTHNMWLATAKATMAAGDYQVGDKLLNPFPLVNMAALGGFLFPAALLGCGIVLHHPLDPELFLRQMQEEAINFAIAPPPLLNQLAQSSELWQKFDFSQLRRIGSGSAPLADWMIETFDLEYEKPVVNFYGSNEGISLFATPESAPHAKVRAAQFPRPQSGDAMQAKVIDPDTGVELVQPGEVGELLISGATVFDGYWDYDGDDVFDAEGFFRTGDLVEITGDDGRYLQVVGRCKDIINRGGMKISPAELDLALEQHAKIREAAVCAYPDERLGEKICACLVLNEPEQTLSLSDVQGYLSEQGFARFKLPERLELLDHLPRNPLGKVQRFALSDQVGHQPMKS